jgi:hypothetical protein
MLGISDSCARSLDFQYVKPVGPGARAFDQLEPGGAAGPVVIVAQVCANVASLDHGIDETLGREMRATVITASATAMVAAGQRLRFNLRRENLPA